MKRSRRGVSIEIARVAAVLMIFLPLAIRVSVGPGTPDVLMSAAALAIAGLAGGRRLYGIAVLLFAVILILEYPFAAAGFSTEQLPDLVVSLGLGYVVADSRDRNHFRWKSEDNFEQKYWHLVEKSLAGHFIYRDDCVLYSNTRFLELLGYQKEEVIGKPFWDFVFEEDRAKVRDMLDRRASGATVDLHYECRLNAKDGRTLWVEIVSSPAEHEGEPAVLVSAYNITSRKLIEEQRRELSKLAQRQQEQLVHSTRLAEMGEMAAGVAHELNQPLTGIKNFARNAAYMLDEGVGNIEEVKENLRLISSQVDRASKIINQMRELARQTERHVGLVDVNNTLRESVEFVTPQLKLSGVEVAFDLSSSLPEVIGDRIRLEQVFLNLLTNARQAMEEAAERRLSVTTRYEPDGAWPVIVEVADTGKGFAPDVAEKLFQPFFSTKKAGHGTGLGLSISLGIIKDHKGTIEASGVEGQGAKFTVRLPVGKLGDMPDGKQGEATLTPPM